jgi:hypothetical protein
VPVMMKFAFFYCLVINHDIFITILILHCWCPGVLRHADSGELFQKIFILFV